MNLFGLQLSKNENNMEIKFLKQLTLLQSNQIENGLQTKHNVSEFYLEVGTYFKFWIQIEAILIKLKTNAKIDKNWK